MGIALILMIVAIVACGLGLRDVLSRTDEDFVATRQSRRLWIWVFVALIVLVIVSLGLLSPAALAMSAMYFFVYRRRMEKASAGPIDVEEV